MSAGVFDILCNGLLTAVAHVMIRCVLTRRYSAPLTTVLQILHTILSTVLYGLIPEGSLFQVPIHPLMILLFALFVYREKWWSYVLMTLIYGLVEYVVVALFYPVQEAAMPAGILTLGQMIVAWMPLFLGTLSALWLAYVGLRLFQDRLSGGDILLYAGIPVSQFLVAYEWNNIPLGRENASGAWIYTLVMVLIFVADIGVFLSMLRVSRQKELEAENRFLAAQIDAQRLHYAELTDQYENIRKMRHDIAKHMAAMDGLLTAGQNAEAADYAARLRAEPPTVGYCENPVVDAFLTASVRRAGEAGVRLKVDVSVPAEISVSSTDMVCIYGNLLDSAVSACRGVTEAAIDIRTTVDGDWLRISAECPVSPALGKSALKRRMERSIGPRVLADMAGKYCGEFCCGGEGSRFRLEITCCLAGGGSDG